MTRLAYFPVVEDEAHLIDIVSRAAWFLTFSSIEKIFVFVADERLAETEWEVAPGMDPAISDRFDTLRELIEFVPVSSRADTARAMRQVSTVLRWRERGSSPWVPTKRLKKWLEGKDVLRVDPRATRYEGSFYIDVSFHQIRRDTAVLEENQRKFDLLADRLGQREQAYVLATGPSVGSYTQFDYADALSIACNTVILDEELMETVRPEILAFADPIFHFGPSQYAATFRDSVRAAASKFDFDICIPLKYYGIFTAAVPELAARTIGIPFRKEREFNFDLATDFELRTTANVLTYVMLPLAATFARRVGILGCDGRALDQETYFWSHHRSTQLNERMANIQQVHPAFFDIDYNEYYLEHCETLAEELEAGEQAGRRFECLGFSHIPALKNRMAVAMGDGDGETGGLEPEQTAPSEAMPVGRAVAGSTGNGAGPGERPGPVLGPFPRDAGAGLDEGKAIAKLLAARGPEHVLIDVGAHHGSSLAPFSKAGWTAVACEPDASNRKRLVKRFGDKPNVTIDPRAVSDEPAEGVAFFSSDESTGISALHAFRETHEQADVVDVTTVAELVDAHALSRVDFLKIDVEGFDWNVLKGVPWDRVEPRVIECEFEDAKTIPLGHTYRDMADFLVERGYTVYLSEWHPIIRYGIRHQWRQLVRYPAPLGSADAWGNIVAFREDQGVEAVRSAFAEILELEDPSAAEAGGDEPGAVEAKEVAPIQATVQEGNVPRPSQRDRIARAARVGNRRQRQEHAVMPKRRGRRARRLAGWTASVGLVVGLVVAGFLAALEPYRLVLWSAAGLLVAAGAGLWIARAIRRRRDPTVRTGPSLRDRFSAWAKNRSPAVVPIGRLVLWLARRARRYPALMLPYVALLAALVVVGFLPAVEPYGPIAWSAAGLLVVAGAIGISTGYAGFLVREADQESQLQRSQIRTRLNHTRERLARTDTRHEELREHLDAAVSGLRSTEGAALEALEAKIAALEGEEQATRATLEARLGDLKSKLGVFQELSEGVAALGREVTPKIAALESDQKATREALEAKVAVLESTQGSVHETLDAKIAELRSQHEEAKETLARTSEQRAAEALGKIGELHSGQEAMKETLEAGIAEVHSAQRAMREALKDIGTAQSEEREAALARVRNLQSSQQTAREALAGRIGQLESKHEEARDALETRVDELRSEHEGIREALARIDDVRSEHEATREGLDAKIAELRSEQEEGQAAREALAASFGQLESEHEKTKAALEARADELRSEHEAIREALAQIAELRSQHEATREDLEARIGELRPDPQTLRALARVRDLESEHKEALEAQVRTLESQRKATGDLRRHVFLRLAQMSGQSVTFEDLVVVIAPPRSGSTWLLDLLRSHPAGLFLPTADIYRELGVRGRRYPVHLSDGADATLDVEVQAGVGATVPSFGSERPEVDVKTRAAIEKVHPAAIRFDATEFLDRVDRLGSARGKQVRLVYLVRDPVDSLRSFLAYRKREPGWHADAPEIAGPDLYLRSFEVIDELTSARPGPVIQYEELTADAVTGLTRLYRWLWPDIEGSEHMSAAAAATEATRRERRRETQTGRFIGEPDGAVPSDLSLLLGMSDGDFERGRRMIDECRRLHSAIVARAVELPSESDRRRKSTTRRKATAGSSADGRGKSTAGRKPRSRR